MNKALAFLLLLLTVSCSKKKEFKALIEKQLPLKASVKVKEVCNKYINDCVEMYGYFENVETKNPEEANKAQQRFAKNYPDNYMLKAGTIVCKENNITDSTDIKTIQTFVNNIMEEYFTYQRR